MVPRRGKVCSYSHDSNLNDRGTQPDVAYKLKKEVKTMGIIAALIIVAVFGVSLLVWFHYEDKHHSVSAE